MAMNVGSPDDGADDEMIAAINTTPLVDVMLVLLIIFLITIPVVIHTVPVNLPVASNIPTTTKPQNIVISVDEKGEVFWNETLVPDEQTLIKRLEVEAVKVPQPEVHIRGDKDARYEYIGRVVVACQRASILKVGFITEPTAPTSF